MGLQDKNTCYDGIVTKLSELNIVNQNGSIIDIIEHYLSSLDTDSQKIEECHNIIKYCKNVSVKLQEVK